MPVVVNGVDISTCNKIKVKGTDGSYANVEVVMANDVEVWRRACPPTVPISLTVSSGTCEKLTFQWNDTDGYPAPQYDIHSSDGTLLYPAQTSPVTHNCPGGEVESFYIRAWNSAGEKESNIIADITCVLCCVPLSVIFDVPGDHEWENTSGILSVDVCMIGGGGGGGFDSGVGSDDGGAGGSEVSNTYTVTPEVAYYITVGVGGLGALYLGTAGAGTASSFDTLATAAGGAGSAYQGNGATRSGCWGTSTDGLSFFGSSALWGGQAGFGNGGKGGNNESIAGNGGVGAGGGGTSGLTSTAGNGGRGEVRLESTCGGVKNKASIEFRLVSKMSDTMLKDLGITLNVDKGWIDTYNYFRERRIIGEFPAQPYTKKEMHNV